MFWDCLCSTVLGFGTVCVLGADCRAVKSRTLSTKRINTNFD